MYLKVISEKKVGVLLGPDISSEVMFYVKPDEIIEVKRGGSLGEKGRAFFQRVDGSGWIPMHSRKDASKAYGGFDTRQVCMNSSEETAGNTPFMSSLLLCPTFENQSCCVLRDGYPYFFLGIRHRFCRVPRSLCLPRPVSLSRDLPCYVAMASARRIL